MFPPIFMITRIMQSVFGEPIIKLSAYHKEVPSKQRYAGEFLCGKTRARLIEVSYRNVPRPEFWIDLDILGWDNRRYSLGIIKATALNEQIAVLKAASEHIASQQG